MCRLSVLLVAVPLVVAGLALPVAAQPAFRHTLSLGVWIGAATASEAPGTWSTTIWNLDYRARSLTSRWGFHFHYATGSRETFWSTDVSFGAPSPTPGLGLRPFLGYGSFSTTPTTAPVTSTGFRLGIKADYPLLRTLAGQNVDLAVSLAWSPSNTVTSSAGTTRGTAFESMVAAEFKIPWMRTMLPGQADYYLTSFAPNGFDPNWAGRVGWKTLGLTGSSYQWTGPFLEIFKTF